MTDKLAELRARALTPLYVNASTQRRTTVVERRQRATLGGAR